MNLTQEELGVLKSCNSEAEWSAACDEIKRVRNGKYPFNWWVKVVLTDLRARVAAGWGGDDKIRYVLSLRDD